MPQGVLRRTGRGRWDEGFGTVELVLLVPAIVLAVLLVVAVGRVEQARLQVTGAARDAARAASLTRSVPAAQVAAQTAAEVALSAESVTCTGGPSISVDGSRFEPGGMVDVTITCTTRLGDLGFPSLPATKTLTATAASPLEQYRSQP
ncbi:TadE/TadG family type IV pilus assembly protein [Aquipuribacter sp. MA13-6]|uniref:TadE/TadG family type IV pilus assembly protein n=1 Tax=unclassified Aquipuribacter TaxID=2635084 RepID=UPI003EECCC06